MRLPSATTALLADITSSSGSTKILTVIAPVPLNADSVPWMVGSAGAILAENGYAPGVDFVCDYISRTRLPVLFVPIPIATPGVVGRQDTSGNTNTSVCSVSVGAYGSLEECDGRVRVKTGGVVGTDMIVLEYTLDDGWTWKEYRLGTGVTFNIDDVGQIISLAAGSLTADETILTWHSTAPMWDNAGLTAGKLALENQQVKSRAWYVDGALTNATVAGYVTTAVNAYASEVGRSLLAKCALPDRLPYAKLAQERVSMTGAPNVTFAEVGAGNDTATRAAGSFIADGFVNGDTVRITGAVAGGGHNNITGVVTVAASVLTFPAAGADLDAEGPIAGVSMTSEPTLTFNDNGAAEDTLVRSRGSWLADGFRVGDSFTITGTASNNVTKTITGVTATTINVATGSFAAEIIGSYGVSMVAGQTLVQHVIAMNAAFQSVSKQERIDLGHGRARTLSPVTGFMLRRNANYFDTIRAFQHDIHIATWAVANKPIDGARIENQEGTAIVEHDERVTSGALAAGFTCLRTWAEKNKGDVYIARSVTRADPNTVLAATENMYVACLAQNIAQEEAVNSVGQNLVLNDDGTATPESLGSIQDRIDSAEKRELLANKEGEGQRASLVSVTLNQDDDLSGADATLNGSVDVKVGGKIAHMNLSVRVH